MITRETIDAALSTLSGTTIASFISIVRMSIVYKSNPTYFEDLETKITATVGTVKAKQLNAVLDELERLGIGMVEINQSQTVGTDGLIYSKARERDSLIDYMLGVLYEGFSPSIYLSEEDLECMRLLGKYGVGRLPLTYEGYL